mmetsp:Transcript_1375/g.1850  ORF Transcript_1375/g.1850 Transcript_1375/m.1850 type:complete len:410 (+) Transcript_1375:208-1437(+)
MVVRALPLHLTLWTLFVTNCSAFPIQTRSKQIFRIESKLHGGTEYHDVHLNNDKDNRKGRRKFLITSAVSVFTTLNTGFNRNQALAIVTDETFNFANTNSDSSYSPRNIGSSVQAPSLQKPEIANSPGEIKSVPTKATATDEIIIDIPLSKMMSSPLGIEVADVEFRTARRVFIKSIMPSSLASQLGIQRDWVFVSINGQSAERTDAKGVKQMISQVIQSNSSSNLQLVFRDNSFQDQLQNLSENKDAITKIAPAGDTTQRNQDGSVKYGYSETSQDDQEFKVTQLVPPRMCTKGATTDDLLEISYVGTIVESGEVFDGSSIAINGKGIPGRGNDVTLYFVLGKQPFGQFPPGWDVGLQGICVGERRRLIIPPVLAYGSTGVPRRNIPPNATLQYDVTLVSVNGLAIPQ